ncbi:MAG: autotransporter domain-containing protein, partial [Alphaproteobacteria bacterium]|nr:autotransporter domain-containing protein [Alphaproteobacteria bacterium]
LSVADNTTLNYVTTITSEVTTETNGDTLDLVVQANIGDREFVAGSATDSYTLSVNLGQMASGTLTVDGVISGDDRSTLDLNGHSGFVLDNDNTNLSMSDIKVINASDTLINNRNPSSTVTLTNVEITDNNANGAIISSAGDVNIIADNATTTIADNNAIATIYITDAELNLTTQNEGSISIDGNIIGENYDLNIGGDGTGSLDIKDIISGAENIRFVGDTELHLGLDSIVYANNLSNDMDTPARLQLDMEVDREHNTINTGKIHIANDISGDYSLIVNALNGDKLDKLEDNAVAFLYALNDNPNTSTNIEVSRVYGSPHMWKAVSNLKKTDTQGSTWYLALYDTDKTITPEVMAAIALHEAAIEQTRSVTRNVADKVAAGNSYCPSCGNVSKAWDGAVLHNVWVIAQNENSNIEKPVDIEGKIWGVEGGFDIQKDAHNTLGVFGSYRNGDYKSNGEGKAYHSTIGSNIDIDSYLLGVYYRYDKDMNWLFATLYGGIQKAEAKTKDGVANFNTDAKEYGASIEVGHTIALDKDLTLDPSLGISYTNIDFDDTNDNVGKHYAWGDVSQVEIELGAKLEKQWAESKVYVKPSIIRTMTHSDVVKISGMNKVNTYNDDTMVRLEIGGRYNFNDDFYGYAWVNYTYSNYYDSLSLGAGLNYSW